ncbi:hypothetical protein QQS21_000280 [Conoideocrella luteorostrata]|uniref:Uncharacterized protein n=1 Tax=Conoideocrella luteorostrata TaxID=1105319 RepID=A0AAJ0D1E3_9HYPO|nr:hypothetical protein QQS21_000280 [Conoideocrella luteorostrata]
MPPTTAFHPLEAIGQDIYYVDHRSDQSSKSENINASTDPQLIILCTWLGGATPSRIQKYLDGYISLYPKSPILLIAGRFLDITVLPFSVLHARLAPARHVMIERIEAQADDEAARPSFLWHIFSHGGCNSAIQMALSLHNERGDIDLSKHIKLLILDCCPGDATFENAYKAAAYSLPAAFPARAVGQLLLYPAMGILTGLQNAGLMLSVSHLRAQLNDPAVLGNARRLYLYSKADQVVRWQDVEAHIEDARSQQGLSAQGVSYPDSPHCALVRDHGPDYWKTIVAFWNAPIGDNSPTSKL